MLASTTRCPPEGASMLRHCLAISKPCSSPCIPQDQLSMPFDDGPSSPAARRSSAPLDGEAGLDDLLMDSQKEGVKLTSDPEVVMSEAPSRSDRVATRGHANKEMPNSNKDQKESYGRVHTVSIPRHILPDDCAATAHDKDSQVSSGFKCRSVDPTIRPAVVETDQLSTHDGTTSGVPVTGDYCKPECLQDHHSLPGATYWQEQTCSSAYGHSLSDCGEVPQGRELVSGHPQYLSGGMMEQTSGAMSSGTAPKPPPDLARSQPSLLNSELEGGELGASWHRGSPLPVPHRPYTGGSDCLGVRIKLEEQFSKEYQIMADQTGISSTATATGEDIHMPCGVAARMPLLPADRIVHDGSTVSTEKPPIECSQQVSDSQTSSCHRPVSRGASFTDSSDRGFAYYHPSQVTYNPKMRTSSPIGLRPGSDISGGQTMDMTDSAMARRMTLEGAALVDGRHQPPEPTGLQSTGIPHEFDQMYSMMMKQNTPLQGSSGDDGARSHHHAQQQQQQQPSQSDHIQGSVQEAIHLLEQAQRQEQAGMVGLLKQLESSQGRAASDMTQTDSEAFQQQRQEVLVQVMSSQALEHPVMARGVDRQNMHLGDRNPSLAHLLAAGALATSAFPDTRSHPMTHYPDSLAHMPGPLPPSFSTFGMSIPAPHPSPQSPQPSPGHNEATNVFLNTVISQQPCHLQSRLAGHASLGSMASQPGGSMHCRNSSDSSVDYSQLAASLSGLNAGEIASPHPTPASPGMYGPVAAHPSALSGLSQLGAYYPQLQMLLNQQQAGKPSTETSNKHHNLYKTELCRSWSETGTCRYGAKCQFAHGKKELRPVQRHPKYKTEICRTFAVTGTCPYGTRCRFIHYTRPNCGQQQETAGPGSYTSSSCPQSPVNMLPPSSPHQPLSSPYSSCEVYGYHPRDSRSPSLCTSPGGWQTQPYQVIPLESMLGPSTPPAYMVDRHGGTSDSPATPPTGSQSQPRLHQTSPALGGPSGDDGDQSRGSLTRDISQHRLPIFSTFLNDGQPQH